MARRVALVTGASRGIGAATALRLAQDGHDVFVHYHQQREGAEATKSRIDAIGRSSWVLQADLSKPTEAERMFSQIQRFVPGVDVLVNNAGIYPRKYLHETTAEDWDRTLATNVSSQFHCSRLAAPHMVEEEWGRIINLTSVLGTKGSKHGVAYSASKSAIHGLTKSLALELAPHGITVNAVAPGAIETDILAQDSPETRAKRLKDIPAGRVGLPEEIAATVSFLARDDSGYVSGQVLHVNGAFLLP